MADNSDSVELPEGVRLVMTCLACPEQYDVLYDGEPIGYLRLRHSGFTAWDAEVKVCLLSEDYAPHAHDDWGYFLDEDRPPALRRGVEAVVRHRLAVLHGR